MVLMSKECVVQSLLVHRDEEDRKPFNGDKCYHVSPVSNPISRIHLVTIIDV